MRLAFVSLYDARNIASWSGTPYYIAKHLARQGADLEMIGPLDASVPPGLAARRIAWRAVGRRYLPLRAPSTARRLAAQTAARLRGGAFDAILSMGVLPVAALETSLPVAFYSDCTFGGMVDFYPDYRGLAPETIRDGYALERAAHARAAAAFYSTDWAARTAIDLHGADPARVRVVPFGANLDREPSPEEVARAAAARGPELLRLLFFGVDWERKGGATAVGAADRLAAAGLRVELTVMGCTPPPAWRRPHVRVLGFVSKTVPGGRRLIEETLAASHFILLPARAECFGVVLSEACAYGVPCLVSDAGGLPTVVRDGVNGRVFPAGADGGAYADSILSIMRDPGRYAALAAGAAAEYRARLNWPAAAAALLDGISAAVRSAGGGRGGV